MADRKKIFCNTCNHETHHELKSHHHRNYVETFIGEDEDGQEIEIMGYYEKWNYHFWVCLGCDTATLEEQYTGAEMLDQHITEYFPDRTNTRRSAKQFLHIDKKLNAIYKESVTAYQHGMYLLCAVGLRALLEGICLAEEIHDKVKDAYHLLPSEEYPNAGKVNRLKEKLSIPQSIIDGLIKLAIFGNDAVHRLQPATKHDIENALDLLEALLTNLYEARFDLEHKAKRMNGEPVSFLDHF